MTDAELIRALQAGDQAALSDFCRRYLPSVSRWVYAQLPGPRSLLEDVVSETFVAAIRGLDRLDPEGGSLSGWLRGIARHKVLDARRRARRTARRESPLEDASLADCGHDPAAAMESEERQRAVVAAMDSLDDDQRQALEWKYLDGCQVKEIADRLGRTEKSIESLLFRARRALRSRLEAEDLRL